MNGCQIEIMMKNNLQNVVDMGYCVGCGVCAAMCPHDGAKMVWNKHGLYEPEFNKDSCLDCSICNQVCPFADGVIPDVSNPLEDEIGAGLYQNADCTYDEYVGYNHQLYAGFSHEFRQEGTSGGITTWILTRLLEKDIIDKVICVAPGLTQSAHYEYRIISSTDELKHAAKSRYYPVNVADVLRQVRTVDGRYAIVAIPCIIKGVRYAQRQDDDLRRRIVFTAGIFCGGLKSAHFTEYLAAQIGIHRDQIRNPQYRIKNPGAASNNYSFGCTDPENENEIRQFRVRQLKDLWGPGYFKPNACDFCDDITGELADISMGDAWMQPYMSDWQGTNIVITRSKIAQDIVADGLRSNALRLEPISSQMVADAQKGNYEHRRKGLAYRLYWMGNTPAPRKRVKPRRPPSIIQGQIYRTRMEVRRKSHEAWLQQRDLPGMQVFTRIMRISVNRLRLWQTLNRWLQKYIKLDGSS